jgi:large subunit ribosomal protein L29
MSKHTTELRTSTPGQLLALMEQAQEELGSLRFQLANRQATNTTRVTVLRHEIARLKTLLREDQLRRTS